MPAEAHRLHRQIGRRDRLLIKTIATGTAITVAAVALITETSHRRGSANCVSYAQAGVMGGGTRSLCGTAAVTFCRQTSPKAAIAAQCASLKPQGQEATPNPLPAP